MTDSAIVEAAARALTGLVGSTCCHTTGGKGSTTRYCECREMATAVLTTVTPLIEAAALERAALMAEGMLTQPWVRDHVAAGIRALKEQP